MNSFAKVASKYKSARSMKPQEPAKKTTREFVPGKLVAQPEMRRAPRRPMR
jgi:hypothetical protein